MDKFSSDVYRVHMELLGGKLLYSLRIKGNVFTWVCCALFLG